MVCRWRGTDVDRSPLSADKAQCTEHSVPEIARERPAGPAGDWPLPPTGCVEGDGWGAAQIPCQETHALLLQDWPDPKSFFAPRIDPWAPAVRWVLCASAAGLRGWPRRCSGASAPD